MTYGAYCLREGKKKKRKRTLRLRKILTSKANVLYGNLSCRLLLLNFMRAGQAKASEIENTFSNLKFL